MPIPDQGMTKEEVFKTLESFKVNDVDWEGGKVFSYTFFPGEEESKIVEEAYMMFLHQNALDPMAFPSLVRLETEVVRMVADLLRGGPEAVGNFTTGGTESIMLGVKSARDYARAHKPHIKAPEMVVSQATHPAFFKAAHFLGLKPVTVPFNAKTLRPDVEAMEAAINENTVLLVASAPSFAQGVVEPIEEIGQLALKHNLLFHVDGCMGGIMMSLMREMGEFDIPDFDFSVPGVTSISADLHKYGYCAKGASTIIYKNADIRKHQIFAKAGTNNYALVNPTVLSSRSGGPMAGAWALLHYWGKEGYKNVIREVMGVTKKVIDAINGMDDLYLLGDPKMCLVSFASDTLNVFQLADHMKKRGWVMISQFSTENSPQSLHVTLSRANVPHVDAWISDLKECIAEVKALKTPLEFATVKKQVDQLVTGLGDGAIEQLSAMAGIQGSELPGEMALVSNILDALPAHMTEDLLVDYANKLFV